MQKIFRLGTLAAQWLSQGMTGAFLNAIGILIGALFGLAMRQPLSAHTQNFFKNALGVATVFFGLRLVWVSVNGTFLSCVKQLFIVALAVVLGNWLGKLLCLQKISNRFGHYAGNIITSTRPDQKRKAIDGFIACAILYCAAPLGLLGAVTDGLSDYFFLLALKAVMDGLAMTGLVKTFGWFPRHVGVSGVCLPGRGHVRVPDLRPAVARTARAD
ncbi:MAG: DUF554 family protein [Limisphaerales bacterium]